MQVTLAGFNIDKNLIDSNISSDVATPEVLCAAYARISRSSKSIFELRKNAQLELEKARNSNQNIIYEMGHSSIAEHAVFNFDLVGVSRLMSEYIQRSRLASFTEKSQRYVTFENDYVIPIELTGNQKERFIELADKLFDEYQNTYNILVNKLQTPGLKKRDVENMAKEDARYILPLATKTQMGMTINARSLEGLLRRLNSLKLEEARLLADRISELVRNIAPSIIKYTNADCFYQKEISLAYTEAHTASADSVKLLSHTDNVDTTVLTHLLYDKSDTPYEDVSKAVSTLTDSEKAGLWDQVFDGIKAWHKMPRAFEMADFTFEFVMSESCWSQFKRHRLCSIIKQAADHKLGYRLPSAIFMSGRENIWKSLMNDIDELFKELNNSNKFLGGYIRSNAHHVRVVAKMNLRELYHFVRLRSDEHAQWEIRELSDKVVSTIKPIAPCASKYLMGKSVFDAKD